MLVVIVAVACCWDVGCCYVLWFGLRGFCLIVYSCRLVVRLFILVFLSSASGCGGIGF